MASYNRWQGRPPLKFDEVVVHQFSHTGYLAAIVCGGLTVTNSLCNGVGLFLGDFLTLKGGPSTNTKISPKFKKYNFEEQSQGVQKHRKLT